MDLIPNTREGAHRDADRRMKKASPDSAVVCWRLKEDPQRLCEMLKGTSSELGATMAGVEYEAHASGMRLNVAIYFLTLIRYVIDALLLLI